MRISAAISFLIVITSLTHGSFVIATGKTVNGRVTGGTPTAIGEFPHTNSPFIFDSNVNFSYYDELSPTPEQLIFTGWGSTTGNGGLYSNELQNATVTLNYNSTICQLAYEIYNNAYMICTGDNWFLNELDHASPCYYDEGSPLMQNGFVVGVMSRNKGCDAAGTIEPTIFTRLSPYYTWISTTAGLQPVSCNLSM
ncbi:hypothetical protein DAPPUDRAFT_331826 [Daphnia pulex]|uniref:Peptidase S1 domain-containing protein n=1 Tax=Daphnia pulex TaxID=6669 RepID=E9HNJ5_DAPPU|nr:hypothetical protein DAPPUDRAFT_331826 [Daphnia pulex]|eukprot:EFX66677.1 hypothetical protein DAPPUDRAFT_331826 [Daphnia pulex]